MKMNDSIPPTGSRTFEEHLQIELPKLSRREAQIAQYMLLNMDALSFETGVSLASKVGVSEITVSRFLRRLGYEGMRGLKRELHQQILNRDPVEDVPAELDVPRPFTEILNYELDALQDVFRQCASPMWIRLVRTIADADRVYVTGFQTVRGIAEDCARRLALARNDVQFISVHDSMLTEWLLSEEQSAKQANECLILIDVVNYAREAPILAKLCNESNRDLIIVTDETCHWAKNYTDLIIHASTRSGLFLESMVAMTAALNLLVHAVAEQDSEALEARINSWKVAAKTLNLF
ncbi:MAG: MurR/RpiR family transcriptional regulator [Gammaproteobacteria bacterium]|nr:MurR/RpiR family transcriptional regulator [Gammaproteobacteria bacterium]MDH3466982.1 MurR/RpiR family transcriptional regulator [Gammaproteobacteria bacterium]